MGYTLEEMIVMPLDTVMEKIHPEDLPNVRKAINEAFLRSKASGEIEYRQ